MGLMYQVSMWTNVSGTTNAVKATISTNAAIHRDIKLQICFIYFLFQHINTLSNCNMIIGR